MEAIAHLILLRASRREALTGVRARPASISVNGKSLAVSKAAAGRALADGTAGGGAVQIGERVYVPVAGFMKAAGLRYTWDAGKGELVVDRPNGPRATLHFGSAKAAVSRVEAEALPLRGPLIRDGDRPVLLLQDLAALVGGRLAQAEENAYRLTFRP